MFDFLIQTPHLLKSGCGVWIFTHLSYVFYSFLRLSFIIMHPNHWLVSL